MRVLVAGIEPGSTELGDDVQLLPAAVAGGEHGTEEHVSIGAVSKALKQRRKFDAGARTLGQGAPWFNLVPVVDGYMRCLSAHCAAWRSENPVPTASVHLHCRGLVDLVEMVHELRKASAGRRSGSLCHGRRCPHGTPRVGVTARQETRGGSKAKAMTDAADKRQSREGPPSEGALTR